LSVFERLGGGGRRRGGWEPERRGKRGGSGLYLFRIDRFEKGKGKKASSIFKERKKEKCLNWRISSSAVTLGKKKKKEEYHSSLPGGEGEGKRAYLLSAIARGEKEGTEKGENLAKGERRDPH